MYQYVFTSFIQVVLLGIEFFRLCIVLFQTKTAVQTTTANRKVHCQDELQQLTTAESPTRDDTPSPQHTEM